MDTPDRIHRLRGGTWAEARITSRHIDELIGMCRGIILDGEVNQNEAEGLLRWLEQYKDVRDRWPGSAIFDRLSEALADGHLDLNEQGVILRLISEVTSNPTSVEPIAESPASMPWDDPQPDVVHEGKRFCLTGEFVRGTRPVIAKMIKSRGGACADSVSGKTNYVVVGMYGSEEWKHSGFGTKILKAMELKATGLKIAIVSEKHWINFLE